MDYCSLEVVWQSQCSHVMYVTHVTPKIVTLKRL